MKQIKKEDAYMEIPREILIMTKKNLDWRIIVAAIFAIGAIEVTALLKGVDGALLTVAVALIAGLAGYVIPSPVKFK